MLYEVAILHAFKEDKMATFPEALMYGPVAFVASNEQAAGIAAAIEAQNKGVTLDMSRLVVIVRPFADD
jgi:hypothetical protein